jgi:hypothetical protein
MLTANLNMTGNLVLHAQASLISMDGTGVEIEKTPFKVMADKEKLTVGQPQSLHGRPVLHNTVGPCYEAHTFILLQH